MAVIPKYFSDGPVTPAFSNARVDPSTAAAPYVAAEKTTAHLMDIFQNELGAWHGVLKQKEQEQKAAETKNRKVQEGLYNAEAMATISLGAADIRKKAIGGADGVSNTAGAADLEFQKLADSVIANAPTDESKIALTRNLLGTRAKLYSQVTDESTKVNNQINMDKLEGMLSNYEAGAASNPAAADMLKEHSTAIFDSMKELGLPAHSRMQIQQKFNRSVDYHAAASSAELDPFGTKQRLDAGEFDALGAAGKNKLSSTIKSSLGAATRQAKDALKDVEARIMAGMPLPQDFEARANLASKAGLNDELQSTVRLLDVAKMTAGKSMNDLIATSEELKRMAAKGDTNVDPKHFKKLVKYMDTNIQAMKSDPFTYAENQGSFQPSPIISDFTQLNPDDAQKRGYRALQIQEAYGIEAPALRASELKIAASQLDSLPAPEKLKVLGSLSALGEPTIKALAKLTDKKDGGLAQAIRMYQVDPERAMKILEGRDVMRAKQGPNVTKSDRDMAAELALSNFAMDDPELRTNMINAGMAYHAKDAADGGQDDLSKSIAKANNLMTVDRNGMFSGKYQTIAPAPDMTTNELDRLVDTGLTSEAEWKAFGSGVPTRTASGAPLPANRISPSDYDYVSARNGRYKVMYEGSPVVDVDGSPVYVDLKALHRDKAPITK